MFFWVLFFFSPKLRESRHIRRRETSAVPVCKRGGCGRWLPPSRPRQAGQGVPAAAPLRASPSSAARGPGQRARRWGAEGGGLTLLKCHTLMGMENVDFLCIPGTTPWGGDL